jgi:hypothetical protein
MNISKRKRFVRPARIIPIADEEEFDFYKKFKEMLSEEYKNELSFHLMLTRDVHFVIDEKIKNLEKNKKNDEKQKQQSRYLFTAHPKISRSGLIDSFAMLDAKIGRALFYYQVRRLKRKREEIKDWQKIEEGLNECLNGSEIPNEFKGYRSLIQNFRELRHQFAHNPVGIFSFSADKDNFESFVISLKGIKLDKSYHVSSNGKAAAFICYDIESDAFLHKFFNESIEFYSMLLEILFPTKSVS